MGAFKISEFDSKDSPGSGRRMDRGFLDMLGETRKVYGAPMRVTSGYRTIAHNRAVGGVENSAHTLGKAADIAFAGDPRKLIEAGIKAGFRRIGIGRSFIHFDNDGTKATPAIWFYPDTAEKNKALKGPALAAMAKAGDPPGKTKTLLYALAGLLLIAAPVSFYLYKKKNGTTF